jgi:hypothetical protein
MMTRLNNQALEVLKGYKATHEARIKSVYQVEGRQVSYSDIIIYLNDLLTNNIIDVICNDCDNYFALFRDRLSPDTQKWSDPNQEPPACPYCGNQTIELNNILINK